MVSAKAKPQMTGRRARTKEANRAAILHAAKTAFSKMGVENTSIRDIIRRTHLASGTFYNYFHSKEDVLKALLDESLKQLRPKLDELHANAQTVGVYIYGAFHAYFNFVYQQRNIAIEQGYSPVDTLGMRDDTPEMLAVSQEVRQHLDNIISVGEIDDVNIEYLTAAGIGIAREIGIVMHQEAQADIKALAQFASTFFLGGIEAQTGVKIADLKLHQK